MPFSIVCLLLYCTKSGFMAVPKINKQREKAMLSDLEQNILTANLINNVTPSNAGILLSAATGMRIGEICALKWSDFNFEKRTITVSRTIQRIKNQDKNTATKIILTSPKSKTSIREIPIPDFLCGILNRIRSDKDSFILTGTGRYTEPRTMQYRFKKILKKLGLPQVNFHSLRHPYVKYTTKNKCDNLMKIFICTEPIRRTSAKGTQSQSCCRGKRTPALSASQQVI